MKIDRKKELEKIAEKLGIGEDRKVECVSCHKPCQLSESGIIRVKEQITYLCKECLSDLFAGKLKEKQKEDDVLAQIQKIISEKQPSKDFTGPTISPFRPSSGYPNGNPKDISIGDEVFPKISWSDKWTAKYDEKQVTADYGKEKSYTITQVLMRENKNMTLVTPNN